MGWLPLWLFLMNLTVSKWTAFLALNKTYFDIHSILQAKAGPVPAAEENEITSEIS